ncbi:hypothetical protein AAFC00_005694 [Neodothiora populina]
MTSSGDQEEEAHFEPTTDALDDVFGSAPNSPLASAAVHIGNFENEDIDSADFDSLDATLAAAPQTRNAIGEHSDVPRLRSQHVTAGYRDGVASSKTVHVQSGFDEGFSLGAVIGLRSGYLLGALEGVVRAVNSDASASDEVKGSVREEFVRARGEMGLTELFGRRWFGPDGVWTFEVEGEREEGGEVTFREVAAAHPVLSKWAANVKALEQKFGLDLEGRARPGDEELTEESSL